MKSVVLGLLALCSAEIAHAEAMPPVYVSGEPDTENGLLCKVSYEDAVATAQSALRYNRIPIATKEDYMADRAINLYININALPVRASGSFTNNCAIALNLTLGTHTRTFQPVTKNTRWANVQYCFDGAVMIWTTSTVRASINETIRENVNKCVSEYEAKKTGD